ncbi:hypothetical protein B0H14DRAFT_2637277 [Mycena olivaceomarginata]|nr:hypothetical protein B0H14DRAFT_2637277 [Mycena olivaceomarginata]
MAQTMENKTVHREKSLDPGEAFNLEINFVGEEEEQQQTGASKGKGRARTNLLLSAFNKGQLDGVLLNKLVGVMCLPDSGWWQEVVNEDSEEEQGSASAGAKLSKGKLVDLSPTKEAQSGLNHVKLARLQKLEQRGEAEEEKRKVQEEEVRVAKEKADAKRRKKKEHGTAAAKTQGEQQAAAAPGSTSIPKCPVATIPGTVTPNTKWVRKLVYTPEQTTTLEVPSPSEADIALLAAESSKHPAKRGRGYKVFFSNPVVLTGVTMDTPPVKWRASAPKVITHGVQGPPAEASSPTAGPQGLRDECDEQGHFIMPSERLLQIIQSVAQQSWQCHRQQRQ